MSRFTLPKNPKIDDYILDDLNYIKEKILEFYKDDVDALLLVGGFGRGEGTIVIDSNNRPLPYNDYDIVLLSSKKIAVRETKLIQREIVKKIHTRLLDIIPLNSKSLKKLPLTMFNIDLVNGQYIFYLKSNYQLQFPDFSKKRLPPEEIKDLLLNRLVTFLESYPKFSESKEFSINQLSKVIFACFDYHNFSLNEYFTSYKKKYLFFLQNSNKTYHNLAKLAFQIKCLSNKKVIKTVISERFWTQVKKFYIETIQYFFERFYNTNTLNKIISINQPPLKSRIKHWAKGNLSQKKIENLELQLLFASKEKFLDKILLNKTFKTLEKNSNLQPVSENASDQLIWEILTKKIIQLWYQICH